MIVIRIDFPAGRWHATAWGSHVNEGVPEWPPCPWRLCRAIIAAWHWKHRQEETVLHCLIEKLAAVLPAFRLPRASSAHTRHYMPVVAGPKETKTKIFDTFIHVAEGESLWIRWDVELEPPERDLLQALLENLSYLGRAESLIIASLADLLPTGGQWTTPISKDQVLPPTSEPLRLLAPQSSPTYAAWVAAQADGVATKKAKTKKKQDTLPVTLFDALQLDTADWKKQGWSHPPGARWVEYSRPRDYLQIIPAAQRPVRELANLPTVARFAITSKVQPSITEALSLCERFHQALVSYLPDDRECPVLTGLEHGVPLAANDHVYFLPECDPHGYVTHMTLHAPRGFDTFSSQILRQLRKVWGAEGFEVQIVLLALGRPEDFTTCPYFRPARHWISLTPFLPVRHPKTTNAGVPKIDSGNGLPIGSPEHDCRRLVELILPEVKVSTVSRYGINGTRIHTELREIPCLAFQRQRKTGSGTRAGLQGYALAIEFAEAVALPRGFGYGGHFGLGLFVPVENSSL